MPSTPAISAFNLKPAGFPINQTHPERKKCGKPMDRVKVTNKWILDYITEDRPTKFPRRISTTKVDHIECLCIASFLYIFNTRL
ncbi:methionine--tRNA ligase [Sesbania bispinosa]|nr:methionine--tRNA ligase [Sesbania bispinosa]